MEQHLFEQMHEVETQHWWFVARRAIIKKVLASFIENNKKQQILEIGCGTGGNLQLLSEFGTVSATELDDQARKMAQAKQLATVKAGSLPDDIPYQQPFDLVCLLDVLEHIDDDNEAVKKLSALLVPNGRLLITVPAFQWLWSYHDTLHHHKRRYTRPQLVQLLQNNGFQIAYSGYFNTLLFPIVFMIRKVAAWLNNGNDSDASMPTDFINKLLKLIFGCEQYLIPKFSLPFGVSIIICATNRKGQ